MMPMAMNSRQICMPAATLLTPACSVSVKRDERLGPSSLPALPASAICRPDGEAGDAAALAFWTERPRQSGTLVT